MKWIALFLMVAMLAGCASPPAETTETTTQPATIATTVPTEPEETLPKVETEPDTPDPITETEPEEFSDADLPEDGDTEE